MSTRLFNWGKAITRGVFGLLLLRDELVKLMFYPLGLFDIFIYTLLSLFKNFFALIDFSIDTLLYNLCTFLNIDFFFYTIWNLLMYHKFTDALRFILVVWFIKIWSFCCHWLAFPIKYYFGCVFVLLKLSLQRFLPQRSWNRWSYLLLLFINKVRAYKTIFISRQLFVDDFRVFSILFHDLLEHWFWFILMEVEINELPLFDRIARGRSSDTQTGLSLLLLNSWVYLEVRHLCGAIRGWRVLVEIGTVLLPREIFFELHLLLGI